MEHPTFMPAVSQGSLGQNFFSPLPEKQTQQPHSKPCLQLQRGANKRALEGCSYDVALGLHQPPRVAHPCQNAPSWPREPSGPKTHLPHCCWHCISSGFALVLFTAHPRFCPTTLRSPRGSCLDPPGSAWLILLHSTLRLPQKGHFLQISGLTYAGAQPSWVLTRRLSSGWGWPQLGEPVRWGRQGEMWAVPAPLSHPTLYWSVTTKLLPPVGHRA